MNDGLRLFLDVARHHSFSRAADEHGITQSAVSQRIGQLEKRLAVRLIDRSVRPLALTPAGELFVREGRELLERYEQLEQRVARLTPTVHGPITVDAIYSAGIDLLNHLKAEFETLHRDATVVIQYKQPEQVYDSVRREQCDMGIVSYPQSWREVGIIPLRDERMAVVCAPGHPLAARRKVHASDLTGHTMAAFEPGLPVARRIRKYLRDHHATPETTSEFDNIDTIKSAVAVTNQFALLPKRTVRREEQAGSLVVIDLEPRLTRPIGIIHRKRRLNAPVLGSTAQAFVDYLLEHAGPKSDLPSPATPQGANVHLAGAKS